MSKVDSAEKASNIEQSSVIPIAGTTMSLWRPVNHYADVVVRGTLSNSAVCPVLERSCPAVSESLRQNPSPVPRLSICNDPCLWTYEAGEVSAGHTLVVPVSFDSVLTVRAESGGLLGTSSVGGFLAIAGPLGGNGERLTISVSPDSRMYALVIGSWLMILAFFWISAISLYQSCNSRLPLSR